MEVQVGVSREGLSMARLREFPFPVPPLPEKARIVAKVHELMSLCDDLESRQQRRQEVRIRLNDAALDRLVTASDPAEFAAAWQRVRDNFDLLYAVPENVAKLRQAILQLAVQGKLVPFGPDVPKLPLATLLREDSLNGYSKGPTDAAQGIPLLRISAGTSRRDGIVDESDHKYASVSQAEFEKFRLEAGDLLACRFNGNLHFVGRFSLFSSYSGRALIYPDKLIRFRLDQSRAIPEYVRNAMNAAETRGLIESMCATTAGNIGISASKLKTVPIPIPSLDVQKRLVQSIERMMALCDDLETKLQQQRDHADRLARAIVSSVVKGETPAR